MENKITAFSDRDIGSLERERLEDYAVDALIDTPGGLRLQVGIVCDGVGGGAFGERASLLTAETIINYIRHSKQDNIPQLLVAAIEKANATVYEELKGRGNSTVALMAIDLGDNPPYGRLHIASVGDSLIFLIRDNQIIRLNTDHTLANETFLRGEMTEEEAYQQKHAHRITRAVGLSPRLSVDIGFYTNFESLQQAEELGKIGLMLEDGDTLFACSDGLVEINKDDKQPFVHEAELLRHALDNNVERAARQIISYATSRGPNDNICISLIFIPSSRRRMVRVGRASALTRGGLALLTVVVVFLMAAIAFLISRTDTETATLRQTQTAQAEIIALEKTANALPPTPLPTLMPTSTPTPRPTSTPTPLPTIRPTQSEPGQLGFLFVEDGSSFPVTERRTIFDPRLSYASVDGGEEDEIQPANIFLQRNSEIELDRVSNLRDRIEMIFYPGRTREGDTFIETGRYARGGVEVALQENENIKMRSHTACMAVKYFDANPEVEDDTRKVAFSCYGAFDPNDEIDDCTYEFLRGQATPIPPSTRILLDIDNREAIGEPGPILYEETVVYYDIIVTLLGDQSALLDDDSKRVCFQDYVDEDWDGVLDEDDACPEEVGLAEFDGCPDSDEDGIPDLEEAPACIDVPGVPENSGCPSDRDFDGVWDDADACPDEEGPAANSGCPIDSDSDGIGDNDDACPEQFGPASNNGCPIDSDNDGVNDNIDACVNDFGPPSNNGCPVNS